ncbi:hypothetical protein C0V70_16275 [Bacteriovorax stolpii]|uniref:Uncharacterized protein n=2 Tax=Bacteriovorax stolpii TaxID=960 RepID=A0A2K9NX38_BACTC|nr:hypothetical protein [Bacteriovorax stolpii]AUN99635.1 hypothetical protein C0V70_16275 [Bacteriovorax stolpii]TDP51265.1 hypothetical protein C8D79_3437 [Bacteriovorax stolpii]
MKTYKVDLDYEASLFDPRYDEGSAASLKVIREFEYVFFLINQEACHLKNIKQYDDNYLKHLKSLGFSIPSFAPDEKAFTYWWSHRHERELEKELNSKLTSVEIAKERGWGFWQGKIAESVEDVLSHLKTHPNIKHWIIKRPHSFSGIGHYYFSADQVNVETLKKILVEKVLLEPVYQRVFDIGTTFIIHNGEIKRQFMVENFNSQSGGFKGGAGASNVDKFKKYIQEKYHFSLNELEKITLEIARVYLNKGALFNVQIDSFVYQEEGRLKLYPLVEVNYRKTMGLVIQSLADKYSEAHHVEWKVLSSKEVTNEMDSWIKVSPEGNHFRSFYKAF